MRTPSPPRVLVERWLKRATAADQAPLTQPYLKKLLDYMERANSDENSEWHGSWFQAITEVKRLLRLVEQADLYGVPKTVAELFERFESRELLPAELLPLAKKAVPPPRPSKAPDPAAEQAKADALAEEIGKLIPSGAHLTLPHGVGPTHVKWLQAVSKALQTVKTRYALPWRVAEHEMHKLVLETKPTGTPTAYWLMSSMTINFKPEVLSPGSYVSTLVHELGHAFEDMQPDQTAVASWQRQYGNPPFSHNYLETRAVEDFAECFRQMFQERAAIKAKAPEKFKDMAERLKRLG